MVFRCEDKKKKKNEKMKEWKCVIPVEKQYCWDGNIDEWEDCMNCPQDVWECSAICWNGKIEAWETCTNCPDDVWKCKDKTCWDGVIDLEAWEQCDNWENNWKDWLCSANCSKIDPNNPNCWDGVMEDWEKCGNCPVDLEDICEDTTQLCWNWRIDEWEDCEDYFLEINMRNDGNAICVTDAGVNLPFIWYAYNSGNDYKNEVEKKCTSLFCMPEFDDIVFVLKGKLSLFKWIKDVRRTSSFMEYSSDDKKPFFKRLAGFILFLLKRTIKGLWSKLKV